MRISTFLSVAQISPMNSRSLLPDHLLVTSTWMCLIGISNLTCPWIPSRVRVSVSPGDRVSGTPSGKLLPGELPKDVWARWVFQRQREGEKRQAGGKIALIIASISWKLMLLRSFHGFGGRVKEGCRVWGWALEKANQLWNLELIMPFLNGSQGYILSVCSLIYKYRNTGRKNQLLKLEQQEKQTT